MGQEKQPSSPGMLAVLCCAQLEPCQCPGWQQMAFVTCHGAGARGQPPALRLLPQQGWT